MKSTTLNTILCLIAFSIIWACQPEQKASEKTNAKTVRVNNNANLRDTCLSYLRAGNGDTISYQISELCAQNFIHEYESYIDDINSTLEDLPNTPYPNSGEKLVYGARVDLKELRRVLAWSDSASIATSSDSLYIMMGVMPNDSTELLFALQTTTVIGSPAWRYFDFTRPCPTGCPAWMDQ